MRNIAVCSEIVLTDFLKIVIYFTPLDLLYPMAELGTVKLMAV